MFNKIADGTIYKNRNPPYQIWRNIRVPNGELLLHRFKCTKVISFPFEGATYTVICDIQPISIIIAPKPHALRNRIRHIILSVPSLISWFAWIWTCEYNHIIVVQFTIGIFDENMDLILRITTLPIRVVTVFVSGAKLIGSNKQRRPFHNEEIIVRRMSNNTMPNNTT
jgi:hypothetical protein